MITVSALVTSQSLASSFMLPLEIWMAAGQFVQAKHHLKAPSVRTQIINIDGGDVVLPGGLALQHTASAPLNHDTDIWIIPAMWRNPMKSLRRTAAALSPYLKNAQAHQQMICSVGTASFVLAELGLLDHRAATTHWAYFDLFAQRYPDVRLKRRHLITQSDSLFCVGSVNSIADLMVHLIEQKLGASIAHAIEQQFSPEIRTPFETAAFQDHGSLLHHDELMLEAQAWIEQRSTQAISLNVLATALGISERTLSRRFNQATGLSPLLYHHKRRTEQAKNLLRHSNLAINELAWQLGFHDHTQFSRWFKTQTGMTPSRYRQASRGKLFTHETQQTVAIS